MGGSKKSCFAPEYYAGLQKIEPYCLTDDDMKVDFTATIQQLRENKLLTLDNQAMLLRPPNSYKPTSEEKLKTLLASKVKVFSYHVQRIKYGYYEIKREEHEAVDDNGKVTNVMPVNKLISDDLKIDVDTDEQIAEVEVQFWNTVVEEPKTVADEDQEDEMFEDKDDDYGRKNRNKKSVSKQTPGGRRHQKRAVFDKCKAMAEKQEGEYEYMKFLALYGSDNEGSLYDPRSDKFNMLRFPNLLPQVTHRYSETVSGVTTPMLYIGKKFAPFPVHVEDNEAWSINYLHKGSPKIWYVLDVSCARFFENAVQTALETHIRKTCSGCPCILRHKGLLIHPSILDTKGYHVKKIVQRAGDIVVLPPRCYHWGVNTSDNIAEAINFTMPDSLSFGYLAISCPKKVKEHPIFSMEWFIWSREPEKFADYVNGKMMVQDPVSHYNCLVPPPTITKTLDEDNVGLHASGISQILAAKNQDGQDWLYINSASGYTWILRTVAESLYWNTPHGQWPVILRDEIFTMHPEIIKKFPDISDCLQKGDVRGSDNLINSALRVDNDDIDMDIHHPHYEDVDTEEHVGDVTATGSETPSTPKTRKPRRLKEKIPWDQVVNPPCPHCNKSSKEFSSSSHWRRHLQSCAGLNKTPCPTCNKPIRRDDLTRHMNRHFKNQYKDQGTLRQQLDW